MLYKVRCSARCGYKDMYPIFIYIPINLTRNNTSQQQISDKPIPRLDSTEYKMVNHPFCIADSRDSAAQDKDIIMMVTPDRWEGGY
jgi:hypothetical protein